jgi:hypothetical protein
MRAQRLDDSLIEITQRIGHTQGDQSGAALSKVDFTAERLSVDRQWISGGLSQSIRQAP